MTTKVTRTRAGYAIVESVGIAEREEPIDNAAFTNMGAVVVLREATRMAEQLGLAADPLWPKIAREWQFQNAARQSFRTMTSGSTRRRTRHLIR